MRFLLRTLYALAAKLVGVASAIVPPTDAKTAIAIRARRGIRRRYKTWSSTSRVAARPLLWVHAPSVGEGLMARPVLTLMRARHPQTQLAYTFFSPSAEDFSRTIDADFRDYLPFDSPGDMRAAVEALTPRALVFSKADVWPELVRQADRLDVRIGMISAALSARSRRRSSIARLMLDEAYGLLDAVGAVDQETADRLVQLGVRADVIQVTGDTRFDQVWQRAEALDRTAGLVARLSSDRPTLVAGSTWPSDEAPLLAAVSRARKQSGLRLIIAPHEVSAPHVDGIVRWAQREQASLARVDEAESANADVVLVDRYGVLADLYALASIAFVGGGFHDAGLHSVLEPAVFGAPVLFGPRHHNSRDARLLLDAEGARAVSTAADVERAILQWTSDDSTRRAAGERARSVVDRGRGAAERSLAIVERLMT